MPSSFCVLPFAETACDMSQSLFKRRSEQKEVKHRKHRKQRKKSCRISAYVVVSLCVAFVANQSCFEQYPLIFLHPPPSTIHHPSSTIHHPPSIFHHPRSTNQLYPPAHFSNSGYCSNISAFNHRLSHRVISSIHSSNPSTVTITPQLPWIFVYAPVYRSTAIPGHQSVHSRPT